MDSLAKRLGQMSPEKRTYTLDMPFHFIQAKELTKLERVLTDYEFIEVKAYYGLIFELLQDYALVRRVWPDKSKDAQEEQRRQRIDRYVEMLIAHSHAPEQNPFPAVPSSEIVTAPETRAEQGVSLNGVEHIHFWGEFFSKHTQAIRQKASPLFQLAYNSANSGPVAQDIEQYLKENLTPTASWLRLMNRPKFSSDAGLVRIIEGVEDFVQGVVIDSAGVIAATGGRSGSIWIWDLISGQPIRVLKGHTKPITALAAAFDMEHIISGCTDGTIRVWDTYEGTCLSVLDSCDGRVRSIAVTPVGRLAVSSGDNAVRVWDLVKNQCIACLEDQMISAVAITADGKRMVLAGETNNDSSISIWDIQTMKRLARLTGHHAGLFSIAMTPDGRRAVSGSYDQRVGVWDLESFECLRLYPGHDAWVGAVDITPDGRFAVSGSGDGSLRLWDLDTDRTIALQGHMKPINSVAVSADGRYCLSAANEGGLHLWNLASSDFSIRKKRKTTILKGRPDLDKQIWLSEEGVINVRAGDSKLILDSSEDKIGAAELLEVTSDMCWGVSSHDNNAICIWDLNEGRLIRLLKTEGELQGMEIVPGTTRALMIRKDWTTEQWNLQNGNCIKRLRLSNKAFKAFYALTPDSRYLILSDKGNSIFFLDMETNDITKTFHGHTKFVSKVELLADGSQMISEALDNTLRIWSIDEERCVHKIEKREGKRTLTLSPDCHYIAVGDGFEFRILNSSDGRTLHLLSGHNHFVVSVLFSPDGQYIVTCAQDNTMRIWSVKSGQCLASYASDSGMIWPEIIAWPYIIANTGSGKPSFLRIENPPPLGRPIVSARRLWLFGERDVPGAWDKNLTAVCFHCGRSFKAEPETIGHDLDCPIEDCGEKLHINSLFWDRHSM